MSTMSSPEPLVIAISSRALFDLEDSHALFEREGVDAFASYQRSHEDEVLRDEGDDAVAEGIAPPPDGAILRHAELAAEDGVVKRFEVVRIVAGAFVDVARY